MREYMGRKRKSQFVKPRRNDEKLKKIYKRLMQTLFSDFKKEYFGNSHSKSVKEPKKLKDLNDIEFEDFLKDNNSNLFLSDSEDEDSLFNFNTGGNAVLKQDLESDNIIVKISNKMHNFECDSILKKYTNKNKILKSSKFKHKPTRFTSKERENEFYEYYFGKRARELGIPLNYFYDPLKQKFRNMKYKSFTIKYFKLLLSSNQFKMKVVQYMENSQLVLDMLSEYSIQLKDLFKSVPTILLDQHKPKSKFLWTSYEFYFAMFFFKDKFKL
jgi:hypothetical protein